MRVKVKVTGLREAEAALAELPKATGKNVLRRVARGSLEAMRDHAAALAPDDPATGAPDLRTSISISEKRTKAAKTKSTTRMVRGRFRASASTGIAMAMGPASGGGVLNYASFQEFGTVDMAANPYMRPAWDAGAMKALDYIKDNLRAEIDKAATRLAKKRARTSAKAA